MENRYAFDSLICTIALSYDKVFFCLYYTRVNEKVFPGKTGLIGEVTNLKKKIVPKVYQKTGSVVETRLHNQH